MSQLQNAPASLSKARRRIIYAAALASMFMASLDMQIIATALPTIAADLGNLELFGWVGASYILVIAAVTPFYGKLGDMFGRKNIFMLAIALFTFGSLACGLAWSMESLVAARVLQGLGGGGLMTSAFAIIADLFEPRERAKYQGYSAAVFTLSGLTGPVAGGFIAQTIGWPFIFLINIPIGVAVIAVLYFAMPAASNTRRPRIDYGGGFLLAAAVTMTIFWAEQVLGDNASSPLAIILPILITIAVIAFIRIERRAEEPVLPLRLFKSRTITLALLISIAVGVTTLGMLNYFALFLQTVTGLPPALAGLLFLPSSIGSMVASVGSGIIVSRTGRYKIFPVVGTFLGIGVMLSFTTVSAMTPIWTICIVMFFFSFSMGLQMQTLLVAVQNAAPRKDVGTVTGLVSLARFIGASLGLAANGGVLAAGLMRGAAHLEPDVLAALPGKITDVSPDFIHKLPPEMATTVIDLFSSAFDTIFYIGAGLFAFSFILALMLKDVCLPGADASHPTPNAEPVPAE